MEPSLHLFRRRFLTALIQAGRCDCQTARNYSSRSPYLRQTTRSGPANFRSFSSSPRGWLEEVSDPDLKISNSITHPSSPAQTTPKQALASYISSVQQIIDGYQLDRKENLHEKLHRNLVVALANAEACLNAPGAASESFDPLLRSLQGEISPVLQNRFRTTDVSQIIADISKQPANPPSDHKAKPAQDSETPAKPRGTIADMVDNAFDSKEKSDEQRLSALSNMNSTENHGLKAAMTAPGSINAALARTTQSYNATKARGPTLRLTSSLGKSVEVSGATDLTRAFQRMEMICARNSVRRDVARQRFHVRRGQLKKQMRMERWRRLFKEGFIAECGRVRRMRRQGW